jgi:phosphopantothenoylcysteine decarboxylase/phosphopantothenate--cysteine ligase
MEKKMNEDLQVDKINNDLEDKDIALCITGGIAAIETPKIARHLRRYGAEVTAYTTKEAEKFIGKASLEWATEKQVISELSGLAEHICNRDLVLVAPVTLNTFNKIFLGIADNPVTCLIASALGKSTPVYLVPAMHESLYNNPFFQENLNKSERYGINIIEPRFSEGKSKIASTRKIVNEIRRYFKNEK